MLNRKQVLRMHLAVSGMLALVLTSAAWAQSSKQPDLRIQALSAQPGKPSVYEIAFTTREALSPEAEFTLEFPTEFDLSHLQIAGSPEMTGGFTLAREKQTVLVKRSGLGQRVAFGTFVRLRLGSIGNPKNFAGSTEVTLQVRASAQSAAAAFAKQRVTFQATEKRE